MDNSFGENLRKAREKCGFTQEQLAYKLNISPSTVGMYEQGRREPDNNTLKKIANYFEVTTDYLLDNQKELSKTEKELMEKEALKNILIKNDYMKENEDLSNEELKKIMEFIKANKKYIKDSK